MIRPRPSVSGVVTIYACVGCLSEVFAGRVLQGVLNLDRKLLKEIGHVCDFRPLAEVLP